MASLNTIDTLPKTSAEAVREFDDRYLAGVSCAPARTWGNDCGDVIDVQSPMTTFPISLMTAKYQESSGTNRAKTMAERSFDLKVIEHDDGYEAPLLGVTGLTVNPFAYRKWQEAPSRLLLAEQKFVLKKLAALLEAGTSTLSGYDGINFFHASGHLANPADPDAGTFGNYQSSGKACTIVNLETEIGLMKAGVKDENGDKLSPSPNVVLVPSEIFQSTFNLLKQDLIASAAGTATIRNPFLGTLTVVEVPEFTDVNDWYLVDTNLVRSQGISPWLAARYMAPESLGLRVYDESSDFFKDSGKLKISSHIWWAFALCFPHAIRKIVGA